MRGNRHKQKLGYSLAKWFTNFHVYFDSKFLRKINSICFAKCNKKFLKLEKYFFQNFKIIIFVKYQICMKNYLGRNLKNIFFCIFKKIFKKKLKTLHVFHYLPENLCLETQVFVIINNNLLCIKK